MQRKKLVGAALLLSLAATLPGWGAREPKTGVPDDQTILHALQRLTFGPRPGDLERVRQVGLARWVEQQLQPERVQENPVVAAKLAPLESLRMGTPEIMRHYPPPQVILVVATGRLPMPDDPRLRAVYEGLAERYRERIEKRKDKKDKDPESGMAKPEGDAPMAMAEEGDRDAARRLAEVLTPEQVRTLRRGKPAERVELLQSLPPATLGDVLLAMPQKGRRALLGVAPTELRRRLLASVAPQQVLAHDLAEGKLVRAVYSNRQLEEVLVDFWYNHFNVYLDKGADRYLVTAYERDVIRPNVLGRFRDLLGATAESPAMLFYLDNAQSVDPAAGKEMAERRMRVAQRRSERMGTPVQVPKRGARGLNENYARELLELHTLGVDNGYTQKDIVEVARCFTGWTIGNPRGGGDFLFNERLHDRGEKVVLGVKIPAGGGREDGLKVLDILAKHPATALHVSRRLAQRFVADQPPQALVAAMAKRFRETNGDLREVMRAMVGHPDFYSPAALKAKVKSPLEMVVSALRATGAEMDSGVALAQQITQLGQPLYRKQEPTGYGNTADPWLTSSSLLARMNFGLALAQNRLPGVRVDAAQFRGAPEQIARGLLFGEASAATLAAIQKGLQSQEQAATPGLIAGLVIGAPEFQKR